MPDSRSLRVLLLTGKPQIRRDQSPMRCQHDPPVLQTAFAPGRIPAFVAVAAILPDIIRLGIHQLSPPGSEKGIHLPICLHIHRIAQHLPDPGTFPVPAPLLHALCPEPGCHLPQRYRRIRIQPIDQGKLCCLLRLRYIYRGMDTSQHCRDPPEAKGHGSPHVQPPVTAGGIGIRHPFLNGLPLQLGEHDADIEHGSAHRGTGIEFLGGGNELHSLLLELLHHPGKIQHRPTDPIQLVNDHCADLSCRHCRHHFPEGRALRILAAVATIRKAPAGRPPCLIPAQLQLLTDGNAVRFVH